jgi:hypothetical protein
MLPTFPSSERTVAQRLRFYPQCLHGIKFQPNEIGIADKTMLD